MSANASIVAVYTDSSGPTLLTVLVIALGSPLFRFETAMDGGTAETLKFGFCAFTVATIPEICGQDMEVPDSRIADPGKPPNFSAIILSSGSTNMSITATPPAFFTSFILSSKYEIGSRVSHRIIFPFVFSGSNDRGKQSLKPYLLLRCVEYLDDCVVAQDDLRLEIAVHGGGGDGENPGSFVDDSTAAWPRVSGGADNDDASLDGMERADGDNIGGEIGFASTTWAQRQRQHVHAILNPVVEGFQDRRS
nr:hypothetical protein Iba_chr07aCG4530 [Ipomoea batatas]